MSTDPVEASKLGVARAALDYVDEGVRLGVGTGSTVNHFIDALPGNDRQPSIVVSSSEASTARLRERGYQPVELNSTGDLDIYIDGADEANKHFHLIKGGGGALTREKIVAAASRKFVCIFDKSKLVGMLGRFPVPIEVIPMAQSYVARQMIKYGGQPIWREDFVTDNGNNILDVHHLTISNPIEMENRINQIAGVVCVGIFAQRPADVILVGEDEGVRTIE